MPKSKKLPALQFYPGDWRKSMDVQSLSFHDRGVWFEMLMLMHDSERRGVLVLNCNAMSDEMIARCIGLDNQTFNQTLTTLLTSGVAEREQETGAVMSRRMVRDEKLRIIRTEAGKLGGNPDLLNQNPTTEDKQKSTPSSSVSSSTTEQKQKPSRKRVDKETDSRHVPFKLACEVYAKHKAVTFIWDGSEAKALDSLLKAAPALTLAEFQSCVQNRARSPGTPHGERPRLYLPNILRYQEAPLNHYGKTEEAPNGRFAGKTESSLNAANEAIRIISDRAEAARNREGFDQVGHQTPSETGHGGLLGDG